jgi:hypothetical protein
MAESRAELRADMPADPWAVRAAQLSVLWSQLAMRHVALGGACACGSGGVSLRLDDFELDIVGYLEDKGLRCGIAAVVDFCQTLADAATRSQPLRELLDDCEGGRVPAEVCAWLLPQLERTLNSFAELHGGSGTRL